MYDVTVKPSDRSITCPRCGYDQRGAMATWDEKGACPLEGTCAECGYNFQWRELFDPARTRPSWCVEYVPRVRILHGCGATWVRSVIPWRFWQRLLLVHEVRVRRVLFYALAALLVPPLFTYMVVQLSTATIVRYTLQAGLDNVARRIPGQIALAEAELALIEQAESMDDLPQSLLLRAAAWGGLDLPPDGMTQAQLEEVLTAAALYLREAIKMWRAEQAQPTTYRQPYVRAMAEAFFLPFGSQSWGWYESPHGSGPYVAPRDIHALVLGAKSYLIHSRFYGPLQLILAGIVFGMILLMGLPMTFALLPLSLTRAKVRPIHLVRITAYSAFLPGIVLAMCGLLIGVSLLHDTAHQRYLWWANLVAISAVPAGLMVWWICALRCHLRLPRAFLVVPVQMILTVLVLVVFAVYVLGPVA